MPSDPDRRQILASALALPFARAFGARRARDPLSILVLGGTSFLGPAVVDAARARGHRLVLFNRGRTRPELFPDLEKLVGDRDPKKGPGLAALEGRRFDAVVDTSGYFPRHVEASATLLAPGIRQYLFVSSISAYAETKTPGQTESGRTATIQDPGVETMGRDFENYGALKALCEAAAEKACPDRTTVVRPGYIVGPGDPTDRFTSWPVRATSGPSFLVPGDGSDAVQVIDVRDLGAFLVALLESRSMGTFNACGPASPLRMKDLAEACAGLPRAGAPVYVAIERLRSLGRDPSRDFPIFAPEQGDTAGFHRFSNAKAVAHGLAFRPIADTLKDTLEWWRSLPAERRAAPRAGLSRADEDAILAALAAPGK